MNNVKFKTNTLNRYIKIYMCKIFQMKHVKNIKFIPQDIRKRWWGLWGFPILSMILLILSRKKFNTFNLQDSLTTIIPTEISVL